MAPNDHRPENVKVIAVSDPAALAEALDQLCGDEAVRRNMASVAQARVKEMFVWERSAEQALSIYREVLAERGQSEVRRP